MNKLASVLIIALIGCSIEDSLNFLRPGAKYIIHSGDYAGIEWIDDVQTKPTITQMNQEAIDCPARLNAQILAQAKSQALTNVITGADAQSELQRAMMLTILDQINVIRANLPTPLSPITPNQVKTAVQNKLNSGAAD